MERKVAKQIYIPERVGLSITVIAVCWFVLFSPWTRPWVDFWWVLSVSSILISILAGHFHPEWTLDVDINRRNIVAGVGLALILSVVCHYASRWLVDQWPVMQTYLERIRWFNTDPMHILLSVLVLCLMGAAEEIFWRGYIQQVFAERWGANVGYVATSLLFTSMYVWSFNWMLVLGALCLSLVWGGLCRLDSRWFIPVILSHALLNVIVFTLFPL